MAIEPVPCRLGVILARDASVGVIFRRGPNRWTQLILWDTAQDVFMDGQWFNGRIFHYRSHLSPNGKLLIYFAQKISERTLHDTEYTTAWTAISKPPYYTALALYPKGDSWDGGGLFLHDKAVSLNHRPEQATPHPKHRPIGLKVTPTPNVHGEDFPIYGARLILEGWEVIENGYFPRLLLDKIDPNPAKPAIWHKPHPRRAETLIRALLPPEYWRQYSRPGGWEHWAFSVKDNASGAETALPDAIWADYDQQARLVFARAGAVWERTDDGAERLLADFNAQQPSLVAPPDWARQW